MSHDRAIRPSPLRLALVDDDDYVRFPLVAMLEESGVQVRECAGGGRGRGRPE